MTDIFARLIRDPAAINYVLIGLYILNTVRWSIARSPWDALYWIAAALITISVTFRR